MILPKLPRPRNLVCVPEGTEMIKKVFPFVFAGTDPVMQTRGPPTQKRVATHRIVAILLDDIEMILDNYKADSVDA